MVKRGCEGSVLVMVLAVILTMMTLGALFLKIMGTETIMSENLLTRTQAIYIAESGIHVGIVYLQDNTNWPVVLPKAAQTLSLAAGSMTYWIDTTASSNQARVAATGIVALSERDLEVRVSR
jgi:Tfp pilus assembly protein PilX